ncbi:hypothetical protein [Jatrophihabitans sp.]|uniref:helix-turn-helix domain-containing protein n=1 Tax=Jatrophihabitans sp. TaxID=1932789 RepID=UPI0030C67E8F|nr:hypothetical protein [Jatrophihabitans sp.]
MTERLLHSIEEAQMSLGGYSRSGIYRLAAAGEIDFVHIGRRAFVTAESLRAYVQRLAGEAA